MGRGFQGALLRGLGAHEHVATVEQVARIAPHCVRITMSSLTVFDDVSAEPTAWLQFWFPDPAGGSTEFQRAYTLVWADPETGRFAVDVVLHEPAGPACSWAAKAEPGMAIPVMSLGSSRFEVPDDLPAGFLLIGDSASIPAINSIVATLPPDVDIEVYVERHCDEDELIPLTDHPRRRLHWVTRTDDTSLAAAIEDRDWSNWSAWVGTEAGALKHLRKRLRDTFGFPKTELHAQAYWTRGREMGSSRDDDTTAAPTPAQPAVAKGTWRSQAGKDLLAPVKSQLIVAGVLQALVKPAGVLLIDEATSALDTENAVSITQAINDDPHQRTRIIIAQRLDAIRNADQVLFLDEGVIIEQGSIDELTARGGRFAEFWRQQETSAGWQIAAGAADPQPSAAR